MGTELIVYLVFAIINFIGGIAIAALHVSTSVDNNTSFIISCWAVLIILATLGSYTVWLIGIPFLIMYWVIKRLSRLF